MFETSIQHHHPRPPIPHNPFVLGLDLGKYADHSALAVLERVDSFGDRDPVTFAYGHTWSLQVRHLQRYALGLSYPVIVDRVIDLVSRSEIRSKGTLVVDATGLGAPVVDLFLRTRLPISLVPVVITSGDTLSVSNGRFRVPRTDILDAVHLGFQLDRLHVASTIPGAPLLFKELVNFQLRPAAGPGSFLTPRVTEHDDLVLSVALATWYANHHWHFR